MRLVFLLLTGVFCYTGSADILLVPEEYMTIEEAFNSAEDGDEISVAPGVHDFFRIVGGGASPNDVKIYSRGSTSETVLQSSSGNPELFLDFGQGLATLEGFTIRTPYVGAGNVAEFIGDVNVRDLHFDHCVVGGRIVSWDTQIGNKGEFSNITFTGCSAERIFSDDRLRIVQNISFYDCEAGGYLAFFFPPTASLSDWTVKNLVFENCKAGSDLVQISAGNYAPFDGLRIENCESQESILVCSGVLLKNAFIRGNFANGLPGNAGTVRANSSLLIGCAAVQNTAWVGAGYVLHDTFLSQSTASCNEAIIGGGAIYAECGSYVIRCGGCGNYPDSILSIPGSACEPSISDTFFEENCGSSLFDCEGDSDGDGIPDACDVDTYPNAPDCDGNGIVDACQEDSDGDGSIDPCDFDGDQDQDGIPDECDIDQTGGDDCDADGVDDICEPDCDSDGLPDDCDEECDSDGDGIPDECDIDATGGNDCDANGLDDLCDPDCDDDGLIDACDSDDDNDGIPDECDAESCSAGLARGVGERYLVPIGTQNPSDVFAFPDIQFQRVEMGGTIAMGLTFDGYVVGWGGCGGGGSNTSICVPPGVGFIDFTIGTNNAVAVYESGEIVCWGAGNTNPPPCQGPGGWASVLNPLVIDSGCNFNVCLGPDGTPYAWGSSGSGQTNVPEGLVLKDIAAGCRHVVGLTPDGRIVCWGENAHGECDPPPGSGFVDVAAGEWNSWAITAEGSVVHWGYSTGLTLDGNFIAVDGGSNCVIGLRSDGQYCYRGGSGANNPTTCENQQQLCSQFDDRKVIQISSGERFNAVAHVEMLSGDCDNDGVLDECELDCNMDGTPDDCQDLIDCNENGQPDVCEGFADCNGSGIPDECELEGNDCDLNGIPDECEPDCDQDGIPDGCDEGCDSDGDGVPDECDVDQTSGADCNANGIDDSCEPDSDGDGEIDPCDPDDDGDGIPDECDIDLTGGADCNANGQDDFCEPDCDGDGLIDPCDSDRDGDGIPDECDASGCGLEGIDCDGNGALDVCDPDCDGDGAPDACDDDDDNDGLPDECDPDSCGVLQDDCQPDGIADVCQLEGNDCNANGVPDDCEAIDPDQDCNLNGIPDVCDPDNSGDPGEPATFPSAPGCTPNGVPDDCDDCNQNGFPDVWDLDPDTVPLSFDCNGNCVPDECDIASGFSEDVDGNGQPDECQPDCNNDGIPEFEQCPFNPDGDVPCPIYPFSPCLQDCNQNGIPDCCDAIDNNNDSNGDWIPDECQTNDCNENGIDDAIDIADGFPDCNENGIIDICDVASGSFEDCNDNLVPDVCEPSDCNANDIQDSCEIEQDPTRDANGNGILDECENPCPEDLDLNGTVDFADLLLLLGSYGPCLPSEPCPADVDQSGEVDFADLLSVLGAWGDACTP